MRLAARLDSCGWRAPLQTLGCCCATRGSLKPASWGAGRAAPDALLSAGRSYDGLFRHPERRRPSASSTKNRCCSRRKREADGVIRVTTPRSKSPAHKSAQRAVPSPSAHTSSSDSARRQPPRRDVLLVPKNSSDRPEEVWPSKKTGLGPPTPERRRRRDVWRWRR